MIIWGQRGATIAWSSGPPNIYIVEINAISKKCVLRFFIIISRHGSQNPEYMA